MSLFTDLEQSFSDLTKKVNPVALASETSVVQSEYFVNNATRLGVDTSKIIGGFQSLSQELDDVIPQVSASLQQHVPNNKAVVQLTGEVGSLKNTLIPAVGAASSDLASITGSVAATGGRLLDVVITAGIPEAMSAALKNTTNANLEEIKNVVSTAVNLDTLSTELSNISDLQLVGNQLASTISSLNLNAVLDNTLGNVFNLRSSLLNSIADVVSKGESTLQRALNDINLGLSSSVGNFIEKTTGNVRLTINEIVNPNIRLPSGVISNVTSLIEAGDITTAAVILAKHSSLSQAQIEQTLRSVDVSLAGQLTGDASVTARRLDSLNKEWRGDDTSISYPFTYIRGGEELEADLRSIKRDITEIIVHWSDTYSDQEIGSEEIHELVKENGGSIPYHYVIRRNGRIQRGRPLDIKGDALNNGHEEQSIQIVLVGGIIAPSSTNAKYEDQPRGSRSFKNIQYTSFDKILKTAYLIWPGLQVLGHNEIDNTQIDPGFRPSEYVLSKFGKRSLFTQPDQQPPFTKETILL